MHGRNLQARFDALAGSDRKIIGLRLAHGIFDGGDNRLAGGGPKPHRIDHATDMREAMMFEG